MEKKERQPGNDKPGIVAGILIFALFGTGIILWERMMGHSMWHVVGGFAAVFGVAGIVFGRLWVEDRQQPRAQRRLVERSPGRGLRRTAQLFFSKKVYACVFEPILSDLEVEYFEALTEGDRVKARFVVARGYGAFWLGFLLQLPISLAKVVVELWIASKTG